MDGRTAALMLGTFDRRLVLLLTAGIVLAGIIAGVSAFGFSLREAKEIQDDALEQMAALEAHSPSDSQTPIRVLRVPAQVAPGWLSRHNREGLHTIREPEGTLRAHVHHLSDGSLIVLTQSTTLREDVAVGAAFQALVPVLLLLPLIAWLTLRALRSERNILDRQRRFIASAAHELRSPLTAMSLQAENIEKAPDPAAARARLTALRQALDRTRRVSEQFLALARLQTVRPKSARVELQPLLREIVAEMIPVAAAREQDLGLEEADLPAVRGSEEALRLIIANGLDNALRYSPPGAQVTVRLKADASHAVIEIEDRGPGIPPDSRKAVFEPFFRLRDAKIGGAGLGLSIARDAATSLQGEIDLEAIPGEQGLLFRYRQPRWRS
ncbi:MAG TPA: HAMP domain-containing sensor histidine kinase [Usitatibacter sp.]|jgi:signal transduction histidine kinase|nr:HAMP domain-containing sensor histidine kinase [Usitatibacter sp.]